MSYQPYPSTGASVEPDRGPAPQSVLYAVKLMYTGAAVSTALHNVSTVALWATDTGDAIKLGAFGLAHDSETLQLLEDTLRGALSAMNVIEQ